MSEVGDALGQQIGPFPLGGWLAIGGAGIGLGLLVRRSGILRDRTLDDPDAAEGEVGSVDPSLAPGFTPGIGYGGLVALAPSRAPEGDDVQTTEADTNERWLGRAVAWANTNGFGAQATDTALRKYLQGREVTAGERAIIDQVLARWGSPPEGAPPLDIDTEPPPPAPTPKPYPVSRRHTTASNQTWAEIARVVYGSSAQFARLREANPGIIKNGPYPDPHQKLPAGITIILP